MSCRARARGGARGATRGSRLHRRGHRPSAPATRPIAPGTAGSAVGPAALLAAAHPARGRPGRGGGRPLLRRRRRLDARGARRRARGPGHRGGGRGGRDVDHAPLPALHARRPRSPGSSCSASWTCSSPSRRASSRPCPAGGASWPTTSWPASTRTCSCARAPGPGVTAHGTHSMRAEILAVGSELLTPLRSDTNALYLTARLLEVGIDSGRARHGGRRRRRCSSPPSAPRSRRADIVIATGGLGPTEDDLTREAAAAALGRPIRRDARAPRGAARRASPASDA